MRHRDRINRDLHGSNIKVVKGKYFYYVMPDGTLAPLGQDRKDAVEVAHILNMNLRPSGDIAKRILENAGKKRTVVALDPIEKLIGEYRTLILKPNNNSKRTKEEKEYKLTQYIDTWGTRSTAGIEVRDIANFLNQLSEHSQIKHRSLLDDLFSFAIQQGYRDTNPVTVTRTVAPPKRVKKRHTLDGYNAIYAIAPQWLKNAMDIALMSLQRRGDLTGLHTNQIDLEANTIRILQEKTRNYAEPIYIEIEMGEELRSAVDNCLNSGIKCPYLIRTKPLRMTKKIQESKPHPYAVTSDHLTKTFQYYRDKSGAYDHMTPEERPTLHSLRALGIWMYTKQGFSNDYISALSGHATLAMLERYREGHEAPTPERVQAGLVVKKKK